jgi:two-component sensor histidine kinase
MQSIVDEVSSGSSICSLMEHERRENVLVGEQLLLLELTHRINNELTSMISFVESLAVQSISDDAKGALARVTKHILEFARVYRALQMPADDSGVDATNYLYELCRAISRARLEHKGIQLAFVECPLKLNAFRCWRMGMIVSELIANASRHAFYSGGGKVRVELSQRGACVECAVTDNGSGLKNGRPGLGMKIIQSLLSDLNGTISHRSGARGTRATLSFPLREMERVESSHFGSRNI